MSNPEFIMADWEWDKDYPMCQVVRCGDLLFLTGQVAFDLNGEIVGRNDVQAQARQIFKNMQHVLSKVGCDLTSVVRLTNYFSVPMTDINVTKQYWEVRKEFFGNHKPASTGMQVAALMIPEMLLEIDAIAYAPNSKE